MKTTGNQPPWMIGAKAAAMKYEFRRAKEHFGLPKVKTPAFFPIVSLLPQRALVYVKAAYPQIYLQVFLDLYKAMWEDNQDVSKPELLAAVLAKHFEEKQAQEILDKASAPEHKQTLNANTKEALERGAYGCPWFWVKNSKGKEEPFFGSDRYVACLWNCALVVKRPLSIAAKHNREHECRSGI